METWGVNFTGNRKIAIVGAGQVGSTFAYALMISGLASSIVLIDDVAAKATGHVLDLNHGLAFVQPSEIYAGDYSECADAQVVVITAGANQKPGETRLDLARNNVEIFKQIIPNIIKYRPEILLVVSNPVDILTYVTLKISQYHPGRVIGSGTVLDTARFKYMLSRHCRVDPRNVHAYILGEHGDSEVPVWSQASIAGIPLETFCLACERNCSDEQRNDIFKNVKTAAYQVIEKKGVTNFAIGLALVKIISSILRDESSIHSVSTWVDNYYDISDVCLSVPGLLNKSGIARVLKAHLNQSEIEKLQASARVLKNILSGLEV
ncbi:MAG: L-lactate dehydrogenase [Deltaproteobacteria bacterium]|nr:L-lactate dehydrogenase [Deltaproteobacteria bacterium]